jgi:hypothetical protein
MLAPTFTVENVTPEELAEVFCNMHSGQRETVGRLHNVGRET